MINKWKKLIVCYLLCLPWCAYAARTTGEIPNILFQKSNIKEIHVENSNTATRIIFSLAPASVVPHVFLLSHPDRLVLDFKNTHLQVNVNRIHFANPEIKTLRVGYPAVGVVRVVMDMAHVPHYKTVRTANEFILEIPSSGLSRMPLSSEKKLTLPLLPVAHSFPKWVEKKSIMKKMVIVIDPGHGGKDTGAIGEKGTREKDVVLSIAQQLANLINLNKQLPMRAVLTRNNDHFLHLRERISLAHRGKAELFIAIHADSYFTDEARGASVYAISERGATNEAARWLARRDNYSELDDVHLGELADQSMELRSTLLDMVQTETTKNSLFLGRKVLNELDDVTRLHHERVEQAPFVVLKSPDIPSILVETGYLSNPSEEQRLRDPVYQHKIASALFRGIQQYFKK